MTRPFVQFLDALCRDDGLIDVAPEGTARQSSISKWSREDDAQRAVGNDTREFAFHTEFETAPWWQLDFDSPQYPEYVIVSNRRNARFHERAAELRVEVSRNGSDWTSLHAGKLYFGSDTGEGLPLILPTMAQIPVRHLRLSLSTHTALHLTAVRVLARRYTRPGDGSQDLVFLSSRTDGFGERLKSIVNAMALAQHFGGRLVIDWKPISTSTGAFHSIADADRVFSADFRSRHVRHVADEAMPLPEFMGAEPDAKPGTLHVQVPQQHILSSYPALRRSISPEDMSDAFWRIGFSEALQTAINAANALELPEDSIGIHLRAGDILYGRYRFAARYANKVVPWPVVDRYVARERAAGRSILLFGQDAPFCRSLAERHGALFAGAWHDRMGFDVTQAAIFDIVAMSRCARVVAGNSGFSQIAAIVGAFEQIDPLGIMPSAEAATLLRDQVMAPPEDGSVPPLQNAFAAWYGFHFHQGSLAPEDRLALLRVALRDDPVNAFYAIMLALELFKTGHPSEADAVLQAGIAPDAPSEPYGTVREILRNRHPDGTHALDPLAPTLERMALAGSRAARILAAAVFRTMGRGQTADKLADDLDAEERNRLAHLLSR